ncbi:MAG: hypothetical protein EOP42_11835, partial [Sphingobacteriaceae bacterium]
MNTLIYLLQVSACTSIFYLFYQVFLSRLTFFTINRCYLLITVVLSFIIPVLTLPVNPQQPQIAVVQQAVYINSLQSLPENTIEVNHAVSTNQPINWLQFLKFFYLLAVIGLMIHLAATLILFFNKLKGRKITKAGRIKILHGECKLNNGSFFNYIFLSDQKLSAEETQQIVAHEMLHVKLYHSADRLFIKIVQIILWFNPFVYLYAKAIEENHEFEVDCAMANSTDKKQYADLLLHLSVAGQGLLYHSFSKIPLKKRIVMLFNQPSAKMKKAVYVLILPVLLISCLAFARLKTDQPENKISAIGGIENLGKNPLVVIDGKVYPKDILYKISPSCIKGSTVISPNPTVKRLGRPVKDGYVEIKTQKGKITYSTPFERENLIKESNIPKGQFYTRLRLHDLKRGGYIDKIIIHEKSSGMSADLELNNKAGFLINNKLYSEQQVKTLPSSIIESLSGENGVGPASLDRFKGVDTKGYDLIFFWVAVKETDTIKAIQNQKSTSQQIKRIQNGTIKQNRTNHPSCAMAEGRVRTPAPIMAVT